MKFNIGIVGATGLVGSMLREILKERNFPVSSIRFFASSKSAGKKILWKDTEIIVEDLAKSDLSGLDIVIFSAGGKVSLEFAEKFAENGAVVIDNSSAWRQNTKVPLVVSEVNPQEIENSQLGIIANPNCTTMAMMPVLKPLHEKVGLERLVVSSYQAVSGSGISAVHELSEQVNNLKNNIEDLTFATEVLKTQKTKVYKRPIAFDVVPFAGNMMLDETLETDEEQKLRNESRKILNIPDLLVSGTCVRVPVFTGHSMSVNLEFRKNISVQEVTNILEKSTGVKVVDIPTPMQATGIDDILVGRIRQDKSLKNNNGITLFISGDNLRKGAALNAVQIAELVADGKK